MHTYSTYILCTFIHLRWLLGHFSSDYYFHDFMMIQLICRFIFVIWSIKGQKMLKNVNYPKFPKAQDAT